MDKPGAYDTEWSKSEGEKQISYINAYISTLERWYWWTYLQGSNGDADVDNKLVDTVGEEEGRMNWERRLETYTTICEIRYPVKIYCIMQGAQIWGSVIT